MKSDKPLKNDKTIDEEKESLPWDKEREVARSDNDEKFEKIKEEKEESQPI